MTIIINESLKRLRREKGNTQEELAAHLGISMQAVNMTHQTNSKHTSYMVNRLSDSSAYSDTHTAEKLKQIEGEKAFECLREDKGYTAILEKLKQYAVR